MWESSLPFLSTQVSCNPTFGSSIHSAEKAPKLNATKLITSCMGSDLKSLPLQGPRKKKQNSQFHACQGILVLSHDTLSVPPEKQLALPVLCLNAVNER